MDRKRQIMTESTVLAGGGFSDSKRYRFARQPARGAGVKGSMGVSLETRAKNCQVTLQGPCLKLTPVDPLTPTPRRVRQRHPGSLPADRHGS